MGERGGEKTRRQGDKETRRQGDEEASSRQGSEKTCEKDNATRLLASFRLA